MKRTKAVESFSNAASTIGKIEPGMALFAVTRGQFSMLDMILHCLTEVGKSSISLWTWTIADYETEALYGLIANQSIESADLIIDTSADRRNAETIDKWRSVFGPNSVKVCKNHAKIARIWNNDFRLLLRGSMNLNFNPRFEQLDITEGGPDFDLVRKIEDELPCLPRKYSNHDIESVTGVNKAFEKSTLNMFAGIRTWAK